MNYLQHKIWVVVALLALWLPLYAALSEELLQHHVDFGLPELSLNPDGTVMVFLEGCEPGVEPGKPILPLANLSLHIPATAEVASIMALAETEEEVALPATLAWGQPAVPPGNTVPRVVQDHTIYSMDTPWPASHLVNWRTDPCADSTLLSIQLAPLRLLPTQNKLLAATRISLAITLQPLPPKTTRQSASITQPFMIPALNDLHIPCDYIVIATSNLIHHAPLPWNLQSLCEHRARSGLVPLIVDVAEIDTWYIGRNLPEKIRYFLQDAWQTWQTRYLLIAGTFDLIPVQKLYVKLSDNPLIKATEIPADAIYYGCMEGDFDNNQNGRYGERDDGPNGSDIDLTAEIMVGRFPVDTAEELANMVRKTIRYESAVPQELAPAAFLSEKINAGTMIYSSQHMDEIRLGSNTYGLDAMGFESSPYADIFDTSYALHDSAGYTWRATNSLVLLNNNLHTVNHVGHGTAQICAKISLSQSANQAAIQAFTNEMPYFFYSQTCEAGAFDTPNCFAEQIVCVSNAAFAAVMNARYGWIYVDIVGGQSHRFHRAFWDAALRGSGVTLGEINEASRRQNLANIVSYSTTTWRWVYYELNLFGDPATPFMRSANQILPEITHTPLLNTYETEEPYRITCNLSPPGIYNPESLQLVWQSTTSPAPATQTMSQVIGNLYEGYIPPHLPHTPITYFIQVKSHAGNQVQHPASGTHCFYVTQPLTLTLISSPDPFGVPQPDYGTHLFASGRVATVSAPTRVMLNQDQRVTNLGFFGNGSAPQSSNTNAVSFVMERHSLLCWLWQHENRLVISNAQNRLALQELWAARDTFLPLPPTPKIVLSDDGSNIWRFAEWHLDNQRFPLPPANSPPQLDPLWMDKPYQLTSFYLPENQDQDGNQIADWWELRYYGAIGEDINSDHDQDGYTLIEEFADHTNPLDPQSIPAPPQIIHTPLDDPQCHPGPFVIEAQITDTHSVAAAWVQWHIKNNPWQITPMTCLNNQIFRADIGDHATASDDLEYQIWAYDPGCRTNHTPVYYTYLAFPIADTSRFTDLHLTALSTTPEIGKYMDLHNTGNENLYWSTRLLRIDPITMDSTRNWDFTSVEQSWELSTNRFVSSPWALHARPISGGKSVDPPVHASINTPPLLLGKNAKLSFHYWIQSEVYKETTRAFDGGIVEFSLDHGQTFAQLAGPYTHTIYGWKSSPWEEGTPCFAGNGSNGWCAVTFDLATEYPDYNGFNGQEVIFRFHYGGDNNTDLEGWYIDDISIGPLWWRQGFYNSLEPDYNHTITAGRHKRIFWYNEPVGMNLRDDCITMFIDSNDPVNPCFSFDWSIKIRDLPHVENFIAQQGTNGNGMVNLQANLADNDGESLELQFAWSSDSGKTWQRAQLPDLQTTTGTYLPAATGLFQGVATATNSILMQNTMAAEWNSQLPEPLLALHTQMLFQVVAANSCFTQTCVTPAFTVDNTPPVFLHDEILFTPAYENYSYAITDNLLTLNWSSALDEPFNQVVYLVTAPDTHHLVSETTITLALSNHLDAVHLFQVVARDAVGNTSIPLTRPLPVLDPAGDFDSDGIITQDEVYAGTSPIDPNSCLALHLQTLPLSNSLQLSWPTVTNRLYTLEHTPTLLPPEWQLLLPYTNLPGNGTLLLFELPATNTPAHFYRVRVFKP